MSIQPSPARSERRRNTLSLDVVLTEAVAILDEHGERGLTFRRLTEGLGTGPGGVYWYVQDKADLINLACDRVVANALDAVPEQPGEEPMAVLRGLALAVFDELDRHPWAGPHLTSNPGQQNTLRLLDRFGRLVTEAGLPADQQFYAASAVLNYVVGVGTQMARALSRVVGDTDREDYLAAAVARWEELDEQEFAFVRRVAGTVREHDDREQFTAGLDLLLVGIGRAGGRA
ncbi:TetR/AcrR family transcriptional regulator [Microlunatus ginsengisoli]